MLRVNPNPLKLPLISSFGNQICDSATETLYNAHKFRKFVVDNHLTTDDMCLTMARQISIMTTLKIKDKRPQISDKTLQAVRTSLANSKLKSTTFRTRYTKDDSDPLARRSVLLQCKQYSDNLSKAPRASGATKAAETQGTKSKWTEIDLNDSYNATMAGIDSQTLSPKRLNTTLDELGIEPRTVSPTGPTFEKRKRHNISSSSSDLSSGSIDGTKPDKKKPKALLGNFEPIRSKMIKLRKRLPNAQSVSKVAAKVYQQLTKGTSKLSVQQREATPNKIKPCPKRDLSPGSPDSETLSPEHKRPDFDYSSFSSMNSLDSSMISMHSSDFDTDTCSQIEKKNTQDPPPPPPPPPPGNRKSMATMAPMPDISAKPRETSTPMTRPTKKDTVSDPPPPPATEPEVSQVDKILDDLITSPIQIHNIWDDLNDLGTIDLTTLANNDTADPTPPNIGDKDTPPTPKGPARPNIQDTTQVDRENDKSHPQNVSMTDLTDSPNNKADNGYVAVADDDVAVPDIAPTADPNHPRAKPNAKKVSKISGNTPAPVPGRANNDLHWRSKTNREQTRQKYIESAQANEHSPGKGPSHSEGINDSQMTPSQTMARTIEISKVDKGKDRAFPPASPDNDLEPTRPTPKTAPKTTRKPNNKSTKNATPNATGATKPSGHSTVGTQGNKASNNTKKHQFPAFFIPPARLVNGLKAQHFFQAVICHHSWFKQNPKAISIKTSSGRQIIVPNNQMAANALKCPLRYGTSEDTITLNMVGGHNVNTQKFTITGLNWKLTPFDYAQDPRVAKCSVMCAPDDKTWTAVIHSTANIDSMIVNNKHFKPAEMTTKSKRCTKCQKHGHQKFQCKAKTPICAFCAGTHDSDKCYKDIKAGKTVVRKCANCGGHHPASSKQCIKYLQINGYIPAPPPVVNPWGNTPQPDAPTPAAPSQDPVPTPPTQPEARQYDGPLYTERQKRHIDYITRKINRSIDKYQCNRFIPNDLAKEIILGKSRYPPQIRSLTDRHYDRDWAHIRRVVDGAAWDLGPLLDILKPEVLGARIRATRWP